METWKSVVGYDNLYQISDLGRIKNSNGLIIKQRIGKSGYPIVNIWKNAKMKTVKIHRLVAISFILNPDNKPQVNHKNGIKTDNRLENLEWATPSENSKHAVRNGLTNSLLGEDHQNSKVTEQIVRFIRNSKKPLKFLSEKFGICQANVSMIRNKKTWCHVQ